jgi:hypothetical protein
MRKILLASTAVVGAAVFAPTVVSAQEAPTVRLGGYFRAYYGYTQQTGNNVVAVSQAGSGPTDLGQFMTPTISGGSTFPNAGAATTPVSAVGNAPQSAKVGKNDFSTDAEIHVFVNGKTANGLAYGAVIEMEFDASEGTTRSDARRAFTKKTGAAIDEMYAFISSPTLGQIRFGDEDGPFGGLMNVGWVTNFGTGGAFGEFESFVARPVRTGTTPGGVGDNTKIIYLSPQFFGFDFGFSYAPNEGEGEDTGCLNSFISVNCDRAYAVTAPAGNGRSHDQPGRLNEVQYMARWRGNVGGVGLAASIGGMNSQVIKAMAPLTGDITRTLRNPNVYQAGVQATAFGVTVGGGYMWGNTNFFYIPTTRGAQDMSQWFGGLSYTAGPFTLGGNFYTGTYAGADGPASPRGQSRWAYSFGANYRLAPGLDLVAEYTVQSFREPGVSQNVPAGNRVDTNTAVPGVQNTSNIQDRATASVFLTGIRLAF